MTTVTTVVERGDLTKALDSALGRGRPAALEHASANNGAIAYFTNLNPKMRSETLDLSKSVILLSTNL